MFDKFCEVERVLLLSLLLLDVLYKLESVLSINKGSNLPRRQTKHLISSRQ